MKLVSLVILMACALCVALIGCGGVQEQKQIATACAGVTAAVNAIAVGAEQGKVSKAQAQDALALAKLTVTFCEPKPVDHLSATDYAVLLNIADELVARKDAIR